MNTLITFRKFSSKTTFNYLTSQYVNTNVQSNKQPTKQQFVSSILGGLNPKITNTTNGIFNSTPTSLLKSKNYLNTFESKSHLNQKLFYSTLKDSQIPNNTSTSSIEEILLSTKNKGVPYNELVIGVPHEIYQNEKRVALTPENVKTLMQKGFKEIYIEEGAGKGAKFLDSQYIEAGAKIGTASEIFKKSDILLKVRGLQYNSSLGKHEVEMLKEGATVISFIFPAQNQELIKLLSQKKATALAMDCIPRISRAQVFDALSSMANIAGYKAVIEAAAVFGRFFTGQITAAGRIPPCKVLVIGCGVSGLAAIGTAKNMGAIVRAFDTRAAAKEQVISMGGEFLEVHVKESGEGSGGYAKTMSKEFIDAEMALFLKQCKDVDIVITTALIPNQKSPILITKEMVEAMKPGSVIVDLAAENGGNCELTKPGESYNHRGVTILGYTDLPSRMSTQSSTLYSNNLTKFLLSITGGEQNTFKLDFTDEVIRGSTIVNKGMLIWPPPKKAIAPTAAPSPPLEQKKALTEQEKAELSKKEDESTYKITMKKVLGVGAAMASAVLLSIGMPVDFMISATTFTLASIIGYNAVWGVTPALHTPLMSITNAISGIVAIGGIHLMGGGYIPSTFGQILAASAVFIASINISGGFYITKRMLDMVRLQNEKKAYEYLYAIPALGFMGAYLASVGAGGEATNQMAYLVSSVMCILSISGLASPKTARLGNVLGMGGVGIGLLATIASIAPSPGLLAQIGALGAAGGAIGFYFSKRVGFTDLPQLTAAFHSFVGLAAVLASGASFLSDFQAFSDLDSIHKTAVYLGALIGGITFTGSLVAYGKLQGRIGSFKVTSKPYPLPNRNQINLSMAAANLATLGLFVSTSNPYLGMLCLGTTTILSFAQGALLVEGIGGGDTPVAITVLNSYSGWALVAEGFMLNNNILNIVGALVGSSGAILSYIMCKAMNRSLPNVIFGGYGTNSTVAGAVAKEITGKHTEVTGDEASSMILNSKKILIVPGFGMVLSKSQYPVAEMTKQLIENGFEVSYGIHPVAGRLPGHLNICLSEAKVPYDIVHEMDEVNPHMSTYDLVIVIGANDTVNSGALDDPSSLIYGMPIIEAHRAKSVLILKRSLGVGYAEISNPLFFMPHSRMLLGDAKNTCEQLKNSINKHFSESH
ncbi:NAD(P)+ transhydrogenase [Tieghemostelium lacteum]|uniref:NAD(P) transhydrogenase, mitochondrial n=1 Tax=Tieghemostelium lacteum TaxID=361077 RepID=A0A151Z588_TIELA|nr:NAD(P)+ transhydrogenase [Tieghemostelium lacteum]|eukprot:KYQ89126.1 NAD(P)+ transhydrogenase [Tieghemostelium lacteum]